MAKSVAVFVGAEENKDTLEGFLMFEQASEDAPTSISGEIIDSFSVAILSPY